MIKQWILRQRQRAGQAVLSVAVGVAVAFTGMAPLEAEAKRLGGGGSKGMQRDMPKRTAPDAPPARPAQPAQGANPAAPSQAAAPAAAGAAAAGKRSWMGPIAGLAAGLGLAALFSSMGLGAELANFVMIALLAVAAFFLIRFLIARFAGGAAQRPAMAGAAAGAGNAPGAFGNAQANTQRVMVDERPAAFRPAPVQPEPAQAAPLAPAAPASSGITAAFVPASFDSEGFERIAKMIFIRMQTANDAADLSDLRRFTTPELYAAIRLEIQERNGVEQHTDVQQVEAKVLDVAEEDGRQVVSVRFTGKVVEELNGAPTAFDEVWHLVKDVGSPDSAWAIAGIEQSQAS